MKEIFFWIGVIYTAIFGLGAACVLSGYVVDYCFSRMKHIHTLVELRTAWKQYEKGKNQAHSTEPL